MMLSAQDCVFVVDRSVVVQEGTTATVESSPRCMSFLSSRVTLIDLIPMRFRITLSSISVIWSPPGNSFRAAYLDVNPKLISVNSGA